MEAGSGAMDGLLVLYVVYCVIFGGVVAFIGHQKNRSGFGWLLAGFLFGVLALVAVCACPKLEVSPDGYPRQKGGEHVKTDWRK